MVGDVPLSRYMHGFTALNGYLFLFGGFYSGGIHSILGKCIDGLSSYDVESSTWRELQLSGAFPAARDSFVLDAVGDSLFLFGGCDNYGNILNDLWSVVPPRKQIWPPDSTLGFFVDVYDWDLVFLDPRERNTLHHPLRFCTNLLPCSVSVSGQGAGGHLVLRYSGSLSCLLEDGCEKLGLYATDVSCNRSDSSSSAIVSEGSRLESINVSYQGCSSRTDGGTILSYGGGTVTAIESSFRDSFSAGYGGAISAVGVTLHVRSSHFVNCSSLWGGGAISSQDMKCYPTSNFSSVFVSSSHFKRCSSHGSGGAIQASSGWLNVSISSFSNCSSFASGGALFSSDKAHIAVTNSSFHNSSAQLDGGAMSVSSVSVAWIESSVFSSCMAGHLGGCLSIDSGSFFLKLSSFTACESRTSGGGLYAGNMAYGEINATTFVGNVADISGGGVYLMNSEVRLNDIACTGNSALSGGGGALFSRGEAQTFFEMQNSTNHTAGNFLLSALSRLICREKNSAVYGSCVASDYKSLKFSGQPTSKVPAYPGIPFTILVEMKDAYDQTITSDSMSLVRAQTTAYNTLRQEDPLNVVLEGNSFTRMQNGRAQLSISLKPTFAQLSRSPDSASSQTRPYLFITGSNAESFSSMESSLVEIVLSNGTAVCPRGFVLTLDDQNLTAPFSGGVCTKCSPGTYSVSPLAGITGRGPSCLNCPVKDVCKGGDNIEFWSGTWDVSDGMYKLVDCPKGHQLINSIGGVFFHDIQQCSACGTDQYILSSNSSKYSCQACPIGAVCNGSVLQGRVEGSIWTPDFSAGVYVLRSCPAGYAIGMQKCDLCSSGYYCPGDNSMAIRCPSDTFSIAGSNISSACFRVVFVTLEVSLPISSTSFIAEQDAFVEAIASATRTRVNLVQLQGIVTARSMTQTQSVIRILCSLAEPDAQKAEYTIQIFSKQLLDIELNVRGFPNSESVSIRLANQQLSNSDSLRGLIIGLVCGIGVILIAIIAVYLYCNKHAESQDEKQLKRKVVELRNRLLLTQREGFFLNTETIPPWQNRSQVVIVKQLHLEAAARLEMGHDFDMNHFDAFLLCLEEEKYRNSISSSKSIQYKALTSWLLEICDFLIKPDFVNVARGAERKIARNSLSSKPLLPFEASDRLESWPTVLTDPEVRFQRFMAKISKARIWRSDSDCLFALLKNIVQGHLDHIAEICEKRFSDLSNESIGFELKTFLRESSLHNANFQQQAEVLPSSAQPLWFEELNRNIKDNAHTTVKQDHQEVKAIVIYEESKIEASLESSQMHTPQRFLDEDVFISQLHRRAKLLDAEFQVYLASKVKTHATQQKADDFFGALDPNSWFNHRDYASSFSCLFPFTKPEELPEAKFVACDFQDSVGVVEIVNAPVKTMARMREKLMEYASAEHGWPLSANILDPVRASIVCEGPSQILQVLGWFVGPGGQHCSSFSVVRVKNKFAFPVSELVGGYRDLMVCVVYEGSLGLKIIGEIQIQDRILYNLKLKMHKLYKIQRASNLDLL